MIFFIGFVGFCWILSLEGNFLQVPCCAAEACGSWLFTTPARRELCVGSRLKWTVPREDARNRGMLSFNSKACDDHSRGDPFPPTYTHTRTHQRSKSACLARSRQNREKIADTPESVHHSPELSTFYRSVANSKWIADCRLKNSSYGLIT